MAQVDRKTAAAGPEPEYEGFCTYRLQPGETHSHGFIITTGTDKTGEHNSGARPCPCCNGNWGNA
jgi:hypothetical protein